MDDGNRSLLDKAANHGLYLGLNGHAISLEYLLTNLVLAFIGIISLFLNTNVIYILVSKPRHWDAGYLFIANLAMSDVMLGIFTIYDVIYNLIHYQQFHECLFRFGLLCGIITYGNFSLLALSLDRYVKILSPYFYIRIFHEVYCAKIYVIITFVYSGLIGLLPLFGWNQTKPNCYCGIYGVLSREYIALIASMFFITVLPIYFMNIHILFIAISQVPEITDMRKRFRRPSQNSMILAAAASLWWKPTKTVLIIVGVNVICTMPVGIYNVLIVSGYLDRYSDSQKGRLLAYVSPSLLLNCIANSVIYALKIPDVRKELKRKIHNICSFWTCVKTTLQKQNCCVENCV